MQKSIYFLAPHDSTRFGFRQASPDEVNEILHQLDTHSEPTRETKDEAKSAQGEAAHTPRQLRLKEKHDFHQSVGEHKQGVRLAANVRPYLTARQQIEKEKQERIAGDEKNRTALAEARLEAERKLQEVLAEEEKKRQEELKVERDARLASEKKLQKALGKVEVKLGTVQGNLTKAEEKVTKLESDLEKEKAKQEKMEAKLDTLGIRLARLEGGITMSLPDTPTPEPAEPPVQRSPESAAHMPSAYSVSSSSTSSSSSSSTTRIQDALGVESLGVEVKQENRELPAKESAPSSSSSSSFSSVRMLALAPDSPLWAVGSSEEKVEAKIFYSDAWREEGMGTWRVGLK